MFGWLRPRTGESKNAHAPLRALWKGVDSTQRGGHIKEHSVVARVIGRALSDICSTTRGGQERRYAVRNC